MRTGLVLLALVAFAAGEFKSYSKYQHIEVVPKNEEEVHALREWMNEQEVDFWLEPSAVNRPVHIMVPPSQRSAIYSRIGKMGLHVKVLDVDIGKAIAEERERLANKPRAVDLDDFNTYDDIMVWLDELAAACPAGLACEVMDPGNSHEGRAMKVLRVSNPSTSNPVTYWIDATIHAREWLAPATLLKIMDHMVYNYGSDSEVTAMLDTHEFYFMPVLNPDGYDYTWTDDRMWRKNRRQNTDAGSNCYGTDLNRNFDFRWCEEGASTNPCSDTYCGSSGGSEPETQVVQGEAGRIQGIANLRAWITIHAYGQMWMFPWGNTVNHAGFQCEYADDHDEMLRVAELTADAIQSEHNTRWARGTSCEVIYETTGGTDDYVKGVHDVQHAICPELRGNGFVVNPSEIQPSFEEIWAGLVVMTGEV